MSAERTKPAIFRQIEKLMEKARSKVRNGQDTPGDHSRRDFLQMGAIAGAAASMGSLKPIPSFQEPSKSAPDDLNEATVAELQAAMAKGHLTSTELVHFYLARIEALDENGPNVNSVIEVNPDAPAIAHALDAERRAGIVRGPLHGIPVLLKDNTDTGDKMQTAAGSLALVGSPAPKDSVVAANLRAAGAVILGKTNLSEWANFRSFFSSSGWSGRGGQCNNPYALDRNPCGSSSGSAAAAAANFTAVSVGTETDGSIVCPANANGVVGIKPTVGLTSRTGVVPISHTQDTIGPHGRTVADAAALLSALVGGGANYTRFVDPDGLKGARIGVARDGVTGFTPKVDALYEEAIVAMRDAGAIIIDPADIATIAEINSGGGGELFVLLFDFKGDLRAYLATRPAGSVPIAGGTLADAIAFNDAHAAQEMPFFAQEIFLAAEAIDLNDPANITMYQTAVAEDRRIGGKDGVDATLKQFNLDAIVAPTAPPAWPTDLINGDHDSFGTSSIGAVAGYPIINVPMGFSFGVPVGISFFSTAMSEGTLIKVASGFEHVTKVRRPPKFLRTLPFDTPGLEGRVTPRRDAKSLEHEQHMHTHMKPMHL
jgi:amidase